MRKKSNMKGNFIGLLLTQTSMRHQSNIYRFLRDFSRTLLYPMKIGISFSSYSLLTRKGGYNYTLIAIKLRWEINHKSRCLEGGRWVTFDPGFCVASRVYKATSAETDVLWVLSRRKQTCYSSSLESSLSTFENIKKVTYHVVQWFPVFCETHSGFQIVFDAPFPKLHFFAWFHHWSWKWRLLSKGFSRYYQCGHQQQQPSTYYAVPLFAWLKWQIQLCIEYEVKYWLPLPVMECHSCNICFEVCFGKCCLSFVAKSNRTSPGNQSGPPWALLASQ